MKEVVWTSPAPEKCDLCEAPITTSFYDARTRFRVWACLCDLCFLTHGVGVGAGLGQKYQKRADGRFVKVEG